MKMASSSQYNWTRIILSRCCRTNNGILAVLRCEQKQRGALRLGARYRAAMPSSLFTDHAPCQATCERKKAKWGIAGVSKTKTVSWFTTCAYTSGKGVVRNLAACYAILSLTRHRLPATPCTAQRLTCFSPLCITHITHLQHNPQHNPHCHPRCLSALRAALLSAAFCRFNPAARQSSSKALTLARLLAFRSRKASLIEINIIDPTCCCRFVNK